MDYSRSVKQTTLWVAVLEKPHACTVLSGKRNSPGYEDYIRHSKLEGFLRFDFLSAGKEGVYWNDSTVF